MINENGPRYRKISVSTLNDLRYTKLSDNAKLLWLTILIHPSMTPIGLMRFTIGMLADDMGWPKTKLVAALEEFTHTFRDTFPDTLREAFRHTFPEGCESPLKGTVSKIDLNSFRNQFRPFPKLLEMAYYSISEKALWLPKFISHNPPQSPNVVFSWTKFKDTLPEGELQVACFSQLRGYLHLRGPMWEKAFPDTFRHTLQEAFPDTFPEGSRKASGIPCRNQEQEQEQEENKNPSPISPSPGRDNDLSGNGKEIGKESGIQKRSGNSRPFSAAAKNAGEEVFEAWLKARHEYREANGLSTAGRRPKITKKLEGFLAKAIEDFGADDCIAAVHGIHEVEWNRNKNVLGIKNALADQDAVDRFAAANLNGTSGSEPTDAGKLEQSAEEILKALDDREAQIQQARDSGDLDHDEADAATEVVIEERQQIELKKAIDSLKTTWEEFFGEPPENGGDAETAWHSALESVTSDKRAEVVGQLQADIKIAANAERH